MKRPLLLIVLTFCLLLAQNVTGKWNGILSVKGIEFQFILYLSRKDLINNTKIDTVDEKAFGIPVNAMNFKIQF
jgi:uncharacterized protein